MGIEAKFNEARIKAVIDAKIARIEQAIIQNLKTLGEKCVKVARENGNYIDQTGNLRSSIGYILLANGVVISENFESASKDEEGKGITKGRSFANEISKNFQSDFVLIVVAGMNYAAAVESRSRDVLTSSEKYANQEFRRIKKALKLAVSKQK